MFLTIISILTVAVSWTIKVVGFPAQIKKLNKSKSIKGISPILFYLSFLAYFFGSIYGFLKNDWVIMCTQFVGVFVCGYLVLLIWKFRHNNED